MIGFGYVVVVVAIFTSLQCKVYAKSQVGAGTFYPEDGFLAGELTPVWLAHRSNSSAWDMVYERLEDGIVKKAIDYFKSSEFHGIQRKRRDVNEDSSFSVKNDFNKFMDMLRGGPEKFYYPSVLVTMEYDQKWPADKPSQDKLIFEKILYALSYWNTIDIQLRQIRYPGVRIRIAGIVLARDKDVSPEPLKIQAAGIRIYDSFNLILPYWEKIRHKNKDFREGAFNVVATMTNTPKLILTAYGTSTSTPNCDNHLYKGISGLMVWDDFNYYGISQTLGEMAHIMGRPWSGKGAYVEDGGFTSDDLQSIRQGLLKNAACWKKPYELYPPGPPVEEILRDDLLPH